MLRSRACGLVRTAPHNQVQPKHTTHPPAPTQPSGPRGKTETWDARAAEAAQRARDDELRGVLAGGWLGGWVSVGVWALLPLGRCFLQHLGGLWASCTPVSDAALRLLGTTPNPTHHPLQAWHVHWRGS